MAPIHRDLGAHLYRGMEAWQVMASFMGKATAPTGGRDGTLHYGRLDLGIYNLPSHIPANFPVATGMAFREVPGRGSGMSLLRGRLDIARGLPRIAEHGRSSQAAVHFRGREQSVRVLHPVSMQTASDDFAGKAAAWIPGVKVDGTDALAVYDAVNEGVTRARKGEDRRWSRR